MADPVILSKEKLIELYIDERKSATEISEMLFCSHTTVLKNMKSYNIERRKTGEAISLKYNLKAKYIKEMLKTKTQKEISEVLKTDEFFDSDIFGEIAGFLSNMADVKAVVLLREQDPGFIKGSFRASAYSGNIDLSKIAQILGGGGHAKAAGFLVEGEIERAGSSWVIK